MNGSAVIVDGFDRQALHNLVRLRVLWRPAARCHGQLAAGRAWVLLSVVPVLLVTAWLIVAVPLAATGFLRPVAAVALTAVVAVVLLRLGLRLLKQSAARLRARWWTVLLSLAIAVGFAWFAAATHSEQVILRRDAGAYAQIGFWLAGHGQVIHPVPAAAFGPDPGGLNFASPAFYVEGDRIVPQFMTGWPTVLAAAFWLGGWNGLLITPALVGGCAILAVAGLAARLVGDRWAPLAALLTAVAWPVLRVSQTTYSEPLACLVLAGGMCLLLDVLAAGMVGARESTAGPQRPTVRRIRGPAFAAGLILAGGELVRLDMGVDFALVIPVLGWWWCRRRPGTWWFVGGAVLGGALGVADCLWVTLPYVRMNWPSVRLMLAALFGVSVATAVLAVLVRRYGATCTRRRWWRWVPWLGAATVAGVAGGLAVRPYLMVDHSTTDPNVISYTAVMQGWLGLPIDGTRGYVEYSLSWVSWYLGWPLLAAAGVAAVVLTWQVLAGRDLRWLPILLVYAGSATQTLLRPGITPDHPWADRRLVVEVIPAMVLLATWACAELVRWLRRRPLRASPHVEAGRALAGRGAVAAPLAAVLTIGVLTAPAMSVTLPMAGKRTEQGELAAVRAVCGALHGDDSVVLIDSDWTPMIRGQCGLPAAQLRDASPAAIARVSASIRAVGRTPVIAASTANELSGQGLEPELVVRLRSRQDQHQLVRRPDGTDPLDVEFWLARP